MVVDTGAGLNILSGTFVDSFLRDVVKLKPWDGLIAHAANGAEMTTRGECELEVEMGTKKGLVSFVIIEELKSDCILGTTFLQSWAVAVDFQLRALRIPDGGFVPFNILSNPTSTDQPKSVGVVCVAGAHTIPPNSLMNVNVTLSASGQ